MKNVIVENGSPIWRVCKICKVKKPYDKEYYGIKQHGKKITKEDPRGYWIRTECRVCAKTESENKKKAVKIANRKMPKNCECCGRLSEKSLCADHKHGTTQFRGWICQPCNKGIGMTIDDPDIGFAKVIDYYKKNDPDTYKQMKKHFLEDK